MKRKVVITGIGTISPCGNDVKETWQELQNKSNCFTESIFPQIKYYGKVNSKYEDLLTRREKRYMDKTSHFALIAARQAINDSKIEKEDLKSEYTIISLGTAMGGMESLTYEIGETAKGGMDKITLLGMPKLLANMLGTNIAIEYGISGGAFTYNSACASSSVAIGEAFRKIQHGEANIAIAGGAESCIVEQVFASFSKLGALSTNNDIDNVSIPFSEKRTGFVLGEGAGILILEEYEQALARGAKIYCEIIGYGTSSDAKSLVAPDVKGIKTCLQRALADSGLQSQDVEYINAHGTGTVANDFVEGTAIKEVFTNIPFVSSTKSIHGHLLGAAGALEACLCSLMIKNKKLIPQINVKKSDIDAKIGELNVLLDDFVMYNGGAIMSNSFAFGGDNSSLVFRCI